MSETKQFLLIGVAVVLLLMLGLSWTGPRDKLTDSTYACVSPAGQVRVIPPDTSCYPGERAIDWGRTRVVGAAGTYGR